MFSICISISSFGKVDWIFTEFIVDICWGFPTIPNDNMEDTRTYEVGTVLVLPHPLAYAVLRDFFKVTEIQFILFYESYKKSNHFIIVVEII
jgi:hypothetical protein